LSFDGTFSNGVISSLAKIEAGVNPVIKPVITEDFKKFLLDEDCGI
jgi:hypothetical protein